MRCASEEHTAPAKNTLRPRKIATPAKTSSFATLRRTNLNSSSVGNYVVVDRKVVAEAAGQDEDVPDGVIVRQLPPCIESNPADIGDSACGEPEHSRHSHR